jgi:hypothetical protein
MENQLFLLLDYLGKSLHNDKLKLSDRYQIAKIVPKILTFGAHSHNSFSKMIDELLIENKVIDKILYFYVEFPFNNIVHNFITNIIISIFQNYHFELQIHLLSNKMQEFIVNSFNNLYLKPYLNMISIVINHMCTYRKKFQELVYSYEPWKRFSEQLDPTFIENQLKYSEANQQARKQNKMQYNKFILSEEWKSIFIFTYSLIFLTNICSPI